MCEAYQLNGRMMSHLLKVKLLLHKNKYSLTFQSFPNGQGPLAQLGERVAGSDEVSGSIPLGSTINA